MRKGFFLIFLILAMGACHTLSRETMSAKSMNLALNTPTDFILGEVFASAKLEAKSESTAQGKAWFAKSKDGVQVFVSINNVLPGFHGIHIHEKGDCSADDGSSAGGHFNPTGLPHGSPDPEKHHIGDLGNIAIGKNGTGILSLAIPASRFNASFPHWENIIDKSLILHADVDDFTSQPAGNSGKRIGCGVIRSLSN
jgi:Cu-Zn family superoxide dismutase